MRLYEKGEIGLRDTEGEGVRRGGGYRETPGNLRAVDWRQLGKTGQRPTRKDWEGACQTFHLAETRS